MFTMLLVVAIQPSLCEPYNGKLAAVQQKQLNRITSSKTTKSYFVVKINSDGLKSNPVVVTLSKFLRLEMHNPKIKEEKIPNLGKVKKVEWNDRKGNMCLITVLEDASVSGLVYCDGKVFAIEMLGDGLAVVIEVDQPSFQKD